MTMQNGIPSLRRFRVSVNVSFLDDESVAVHGALLATLGGSFHSDRHDGRGRCLQQRVRAWEWNWNWMQVGRLGGRYCWGPRVTQVAAQHGQS